MFSTLSSWLWPKKKPTEEWMIWVGDGMCPDGDKQVGRKVNIDGRTGEVIEGTPLMIKVRWDS